MTTMAYTGLAFLRRPFLQIENRMSNRRSHRMLDLAASGRQAELRVSRLILNVIVVGVIIALAIIPARLAGWTA